MRYVPPQIWNKSTDFSPLPTNFLGQTGWLQFPNGWFARRNEDGTMTGSPNADFSEPCYDLKLDLDGYLKYIDMGYLAKITPN